MSQSESCDDQEDNEQHELPHFEHVQRLNGERYLEIQTENARFTVQVTHDDLVRLKEKLDEPTEILGYEINSQ